MSKPQPPQFLSDLYRDLRDRRLLIPVAVLAAALVAVPLLLGSGGSEPAPPLAPAPATGAAATQVQPAVLVDEAGIRNYRKRLAKLKAKSPFAQKFAAPTPKSIALQDQGSDTAPASQPAGDSVSETTVSGGGATSTDVTVSGGDSNSSTTVDTTTVDDGGHSGSDGGRSAAPEIRFYAGRVDVKVGPLGEAKRIDGVRPLDFLPSEKAPVATFINTQGGRALFGISSDIAETSGEGNCLPKHSESCQFLALKVGQERTLKSVDGVTYRLKLVDTHVVRVPDPRRKQAAGDGG